MGQPGHGEIDGTTRVLVACKSRLVAEALMFTLDSDPDLDAIGYGLDGWEAIELVASYEPDVVVVAPDLSGLAPAALASWVKTAFPEVRVIELRESCSADELLHAIAEPRRRSSVWFQALSDADLPSLRLVAAGALDG
jgi:DNA-binding NarL/FixJ family response regulator